MKFSFIIPVFNAEKYIKECLKSILNQSMADFEIICIDDCSTDNSLEILENFSQIDNRIVVYSNEKNKGAGLSRNVGLNYATGEYIAFVDADDWIEKDFCKTLYNNAKTNDSDIVLFDAIEYNIDNSSRRRIYFPNNNISENEVFNYNYDKNLILNRFFVIWSKIYKREFIEKIKFIDLKLFEDIPFHVESMIAAERISYIHKELYNYRKLNKNSEQHFKVKTENAFALFEIFDIIENILIKYNIFENLKMNFIKFKIVESKNVFDKLELIHKQKAYSIIKKEFKKINPFDVPDINQNYKKFFSTIYNSSNFTEFNILNNLTSVESNINDKLSKNQKLIESIKNNNNNELQKRIDEDQKTIQRLTQENKELYELNHHHERRIGELKQQDEFNKNIIQQMKNEKQFFLGQKSETEETLNALKDENQQNMELLILNNDNLKKIEKQHKIIINQLNNENKNLSNINQRNENSIIQSQKENQMLQNQITEIENSLNQLKIENNELQETNKENTKIIAQYNEKISMLKERIHGDEKTMSQLEKDSYLMNEKIKDYKSIINKLKSKM